MSEFLAPGVYVEVRDNHDDTINGVSTNIAGFIGPCAFGPASGDPVLINSLRDYESIFGQCSSLKFDGREVDDYMSHAVRLFFENGGTKLYITRVFESLSDKSADESRACSAPLLNSSALAQFHARYPGRLGNQKIRVHALRSENLVVAEGQGYRIRNLSPGDLIEVCEGSVESETVAPGSLSKVRLYCVLHDDSGALSLYDLDGGPIEFDLARVTLHRITLTMEFSISGSPARKYIELSTHPLAERFIGQIFYMQSPDLPAGSRFDLPSIEFVSSLPEDRASCLSFAADLLLELSDLPDRELVLRDGNDGALPGIDTYRGVDDTERPQGLEAMHRASFMAIIAAPCLIALPDKTEQDRIRQLLVHYCDRRSSCFAVLSGPLDGSLESIRDTRKQLDGKFAALYYPSLVIDSPIGQILLPPDGGVAGIYAANPVNIAPLNRVICGITGLSSKLDKSQIELLASEQVNCLADPHGTGIKILGARTLSANRMWQRVRNCRTFIYIKESIMQIVLEFAFRPDTASMRAALNARIQSFFNRQSVNGIVGSDQSFSVKCEFEDDRALFEISIALEGSYETEVITFPLK